ncbi:NAD-dependent epimerase/dehydratase family protein (plasmid) [Sulfitobacter faviae]|uniref:NAD-dependent epimerase/dehydratase family protein n=1 Tax=Sulfitobacter faviae TaxID=1775881 RepID=UPI002307669C|nr:NAD-dependent epimerase/dehydratase family protein [Sulfitobacter faviae]WCE68572.1 NAD-dependent epimerase/dehydratase family protein [Sulfitobacter faviae]
MLTSIFLHAKSDSYVMISKKRQKILLIGSGGRVGRIISHYWAQMLPPSLSFIRQGRAPDWLTDSNLLQWDPTNGPAPLCAWIDQFGPIDVMLVLSGVVPAPGCDLSLNSAIAQACLEGAMAAGIRRVLLTSSSAVYGAHQTLPFKETDLTRPVNAYGQEKLKMESLGQSYASYDLEVCALRIGNVAGADALLLNIAKSTPSEIIEIDVFDDGRGPVRSYIGGRTLAEVLLSLCLYPPPLPPVLNIGTPQPVSMDALADAAGQPWRARTAASPSMQNITLDCSLLASLHSFVAQDSDPADMIQQWKESA